MSLYMQNSMIKFLLIENLLKELKKIIENIKSYLLSEIVFEITKGSTLDERYSLIENEIKRKGFKSAALNYSISSSSKAGGDIGWINEMQLIRN